MSSSTTAIDQEQTQAAFNKLLDTESLLDSIDRECRTELEQIISKYDEKKLPILQKRDAIIASDIPSFWSIAFRNHPVLGTLLEEEDLAVFAYLSAISVEKSKDNMKKIVFSFNPNPYFSNQTLIKEINEEDGTTKNYPIEWLPGMNLIEPAQGGQKRRHTATSSFFAWFSDEDREVADIIASELYPNAIKFYSGDSVTDATDEEDEDDEDIEEDEQEDEEDETEGEDEDEE